MSMRGVELTGVYVRSADVGIAAPVEDGQEDHIEGVGAEIGGDGEVRVERGRAQLLLHQGEVGGFPAHDGKQQVADGMAPWRQSSSICRRTSAGVATDEDSGGRMDFERTVVSVLVARIEPRLPLLTVGSCDRLGSSCSALTAGSHLSDRAPPKGVQWQRAWARACSAGRVGCL